MILNASSENQFTETLSNKNLIGVIFLTISLSSDINFRLAVICAEKFLNISANVGNS